MFSHITVGCTNMQRATAFYDAVLLPLGLQRRVVVPDGGPAAACWNAAGNTLPRFYVYMPFDGKPATSANGAMTAFLASSEEAVDAAYAAGIENQGHCEGPPGLRPNYGEGYYGAYVRDPDGNKLHFVFRGDLKQK